MINKLHHALLKKANLKITQPRIKVLELFETSQQKHLSAEEIHSKLKQEGHEIGLATIYRILAQFETHQIMKKLMLNTNTALTLNAPNQAVYELSHHAHHDHIICVKPEYFITSEHPVHLCQNVDNLSTEFNK